MSNKSSLLYGIVVGGGEDDPAPDQSNGLRVYFPSIHGKDVDIKHLAFSPRILGADRLSMQSFSGGLDYGSLVVAYKDPGSSQCQILGLAGDMNNRESSIPGNANLLLLAPQIAQQFARTMGVNRPPKTQLSSEGGAQVFKATEQGEHFHDLLKGLPTHGALFPLAGIPIDPIKSIRTAVSAAQQIAGGDIISALPGVVMSLGTVLNTILANRNNNKKIKTEMNPATFNAFVSMSTLMQTMEQSEGAGFLTANRVDEEVYVGNCIDLLSQATNVSDLMTVMTRLQSDPTITGADKFPPTVVEQDGAFGKTFQSYAASGQQVALTPAVTALALNTISKLMSGGGFPSVIPGQNLFGGAAPSILNMLQRLPSSQFGQAMALLQQVNTSGVAQEIDNMVKQVVRDGGNPINFVK